VELRFEQAQIKKLKRHIKELERRITELEMAQLKYVFIADSSAFNDPRIKGNRMLPYEFGEKTIK
jgi:hypothetical protein